MRYEGGCKCGAVAFEVEGDLKKVMACNCSICRPKGYLHWFVQDAQFKRTKTPDNLGEFTFNKNMLHHRFCQTCGVSPYVEGPGQVAVNARCLLGVDLAALEVEEFDGAHL
ncbi:MAG TPA: GFA family protein [Phenylobacterium sp.]